MGGQSCDYLTGGCDFPQAQGPSSLSSQRCDLIRQAVLLVLMGQETEGILWQRTSQDFIATAHQFARLSCYLNQEYFPVLLASFIPT